MHQAAWPTQNTWVEKEEQRAPMGKSGFVTGTQVEDGIWAIKILESSDFYGIPEFYHPWLPLPCCLLLTDVNECETLQGVCGAALCENVEGSFLCVCPNSPEEFDPMTGRCVPPRTSAGETEIKVYLTDGCWPRRKVMSSNHSWCGQLPSVRCFKQEKTAKHRS